MKKFLTVVLVAAALGGAAFAVRQLRIIPHRMYSGADFGIQPYRSPYDGNGDGVDDQTEMLQGVRDYLATKPRYKSRYYNGGFPDDGCGVCTDVVAFGMLAAGYNLMDLVAEDVLAHPEDYPGIQKPDPAIDFRRVRNLLVYFQHTALSLTTDLQEIGEWQGGDIVVFQGHIGVVSDKRNRDGIPFLLHHGNPLQVRYEEDAMKDYVITGHFRLNGCGQAAGDADDTGT